MRRTPCASANSDANTYQDGIYFAQQDGFGDNGWKYMVTIEVKDGEYGMREKGGGQDFWYVEAQKAADYLVEVQDPAKITVKEDGTTDAISGVTIHVSEFTDLAEEALANGPVGLGPWKDGSYGAQAAEMASSGWQDKVDITVISGRIVAAYWDPFDKDGRDKYEVSKNGEYGLVAKGGGQAPWWEQADKVTAQLLKTQAPTDITYSDAEGDTDAISGVSIHVSLFFDLAQKALADAK